METVRIKQEKLKYERIVTKDLWKRLNSESEAIEAIWAIKLGDAGFSCVCKSKTFWSHKTRPEIREEYRVLKAVFWRYPLDAVASLKVFRVVFGSNGVMVQCLG